MGYSTIRILKRKSLRIKGYDYSKNGLYFVTICCQDMECLFGEVKEGEMVFNEEGVFANKCWEEIPEHFPNVKLHEYIIMPNHVHGIIEIVEEKAQGEQNIAPVKEKQFHEFGKIIPRSVGSIVRGFKIGVTKHLRQNYSNEFPKSRKIWQRNFHDRIIHTNSAYVNIVNYIRDNPKNWNKGSVSN